jgi:chorismate mutase-like protein
VEHPGPDLGSRRERVLLEDVVERGKTYHLNEDVTRAFFAAQMEAAKLVQEEDFQRWRAEQHPAFADVAELPTLRSQIDTLNREILEALAELQSLLDTTDGQRQLETRAAQLFAHISPPVREAALRPLRQR